MKHVRALTPTGVGPASSVPGQGDVQPDKWMLLTAVEGSREPLGLRGTSIAILRAMISLVSGDRISPGQPTRHICFASNATLAQRAHVSIQTVERHVTKLVDLGLIDRCTASNGKRWARRDASGGIVLASGLSLLPLLYRYTELRDCAQNFADQKARLKALRDRCTLALGQLMANRAGGQIDALTDKARLILRRKPDGTVLEALLEEISVEICHTEQAQPLKTKGTDTPNEGHKETNQNRKVENVGTRTHNPMIDLEDAFPRLCAELRNARSQDDCRRMMDDIARQVGLAGTWLQARNLGPRTCFLLLGYILERIESIERPAAYAQVLINEITASPDGLEKLLPRRRRQALGT